MSITDILILISLSLAQDLLQIIGIKHILMLFLLKAKICIAMNCNDIFSPNTFLQLCENLCTMKTKHEIF